MDILQILVALLIVAMVARGLGWLKGIPIKKQSAWILAVLVACAGVYVWNWGGIRTALTGVGVPDKEVTIPGVTYMALGSENDSNLLYDANTKTFSTTLVDNTSSGALRFSSVTFTLTVYRTDTVTTGQNPPVTKVSATSVPTFQVVGDVQRYSPVALATTGEWNITVTPAGGSALYETAYGAVSDGGSLVFTVVANFSYTGVNRATDGTAYTAQFNAAGTTFTLNMVIGTAVT